MIIFQNPGILDLQALTTFGVSVKESDNPIGRFGTGLKYALAVTLRAGATVTLYTNSEIHTFSLQPSSIRSKSFDLVCMDGNPIGFTAALGKDWELWQAYREFYCNALDEGGDVLESSITPPLKPDSTYLMISSCPAFEEVYYNRDKWFLQKEKTPLISTPDLDIYSGNSPTLFYQGIAVMKLETPSYYTWNFKRGIDLTEDRTVKYSYMVQDKMKNFIFSKFDNEAQLKPLLCSGTCLYLENTLSYSYGIIGAPSPACVSLITNMKVGENYNPAVRDLIYKHTRSSLVGNLPAQCTLNRIEELQLKKAIGVLEFSKYPITYPVVVTEQMESSVLGAAVDKTILINRRTFSLGTKCLVTVLLEEQIHLQRGVTDCSRDLQTLLFELYINLLEEQVLKEPI